MTSDARQQSVPRARTLLAAAPTSLGPVTPEPAPESSSGGRETLGQDDRLRRRADFQRCYQQGSRVHGPLATLFYLTNETQAPRLGVTVTRRLGNSVVRHRVRRRVKEVYRRADIRSQLPAMDLVFHLKPAAVEASFEDLRNGLTRQLRELDRRARRARRGSSTERVR